jgi:hypothetical protein
MIPPGLVWSSPCPATREFFYGAGEALQRCGKQY